MSLKLYNTLTSSLETLQTLIEGEVSLYCCGITVYDYCHLGHARTCLVWDVVRRYLQWRGYKVRYVQNFTDIDDKILKRAQSEGSSMEEVSERFIKAYFEDMDRLGISRADSYPRATHTIDGIKRLVGELEQKGYAYPADGDVYYEVRKFAQYGKLSKRKLEDLQAGASGRVEITDEEAAPKKKDPFDFALWKGAKPGEPAWDSHWGPGRPGWHIECSAMVKQELGETIDIHVGGSDLIFPHHENEIAQSEAATGKALANYWLHNGMVKVEGEKMSKSLGNFITIRDLLEKYDPMAVRLLILQAHYRKPIDFTDEALEAATNGWHTLQDALAFGYQLGFSDTQIYSNNAYKERFRELVDDDFNFTAGLSVVFELAKILKKERNLSIHNQPLEIEIVQIEDKWRTLLELSTVLGFKFSQDIIESVQMDQGEIEDYIEQRLQARQAKNYQESDRIRELLKKSGVILVDYPNGTTQWHRD
jgi:cysteinyl-tRNA synthetase